MLLPTTSLLAALVIAYCCCHLGCLGLVYFPGTRHDSEGGLLGPVYSWVDFWLTSQPPLSLGSQRLVYLLRQYHPQTSVQPSSPRHGHFGYSQHDGPEVWSREWPECGGLYQSPIDLRTHQMVPLKATSRLSWTGYRTTPYSLTVTNNGHTLEVHGDWGGAESTPTISDGPLDGVYQFSQLHFHWGSHNHFGSEHRINGHVFPLEMHLVHYKKEYGSQTEAAKHKDGLAVMAFLFELREDSTPGLYYMMPWMDQVISVGQSITLPRTFPLAMFTAGFPTEYYTYFGSLTTPPCSETVTWIVSSQTLGVSSADMERFRRISAGVSSMENNFRPVQALNGRSVYYV